MPFFGRKKRDQAALKKAQAEGGSFKTESRRLKDPRGESGDKLPRGSKVTITKKAGGYKVTPGKSETVPGKVTRTDIFHAGDMSEGKVIDRKTTMALGKSFREKPAKTRTRIAGQDAGKTSYDAGGGKMEYSGRIEKTFKRERDTMKLGKPTITKTPATTKTDVAKPTKRPLLHMRKTTVAGTPGKKSRTATKYSLVVGRKGKAIIPLAKFKRPAPGSKRAKRQQKRKMKHR